MIETAEQHYQAIEQMGRMQRILKSFRRDILPKNPKNFAVFAEGPLDEIRKLQAEIPSLHHAGPLPERADTGPGRI